MGALLREGWGLWHQAVGGPCASCNSAILHTFLAGVGSLGCHRHSTDRIPQKHAGTHTCASQSSCRACNCCSFRSAASLSERRRPSFCSNMTLTRSTSCSTNLQDRTRQQRTGCVMPSCTQQHTNTAHRAQSPQTYGSDQSSSIAASWMDHHLAGMLCRRCRRHLAHVHNTPPLAACATPT